MAQPNTATRPIVAWSYGTVSLPSPGTSGNTSWTVATTRDTSTSTGSDFTPVDAQTVRIGKSIPYGVPTYSFSDTYSIYAQNTGQNYGSLTFNVGINANGGIAPAGNDNPNLYGATSTIKNGSVTANGSAPNMFGEVYSDPETVTCSTGVLPPGGEAYFDGTCEGSGYGYAPSS